MKAKSIFIAFLLASSATIFAIDFNSYQAELDKNITFFKSGITTDIGFVQIIQSLNDLKVKLEAEKESPEEKVKKGLLIDDISAVYSFVGEISPDTKSFGLTNSFKERATKLLLIKEEPINIDSTFCMPLSKITLWDGKYVCYLVVNNSGNLVTYKYNYIVQGKFSATTGSVEAGVSKLSSRAIYQSFKVLPVIFKQEKCEGYKEKIEPVVEVKTITPQSKEDIVTTPEPKKILTKEQKAALKKKEAAQRKKDQAKKKRDAEKLKAQKKKEAEKLKREREKEKAEAKKEK